MHLHKIEKKAYHQRGGGMPARKSVIFHSITSILQPPTKIAHYWQLKNLDCQYFLAWVLSAGCRPSWQGGRNLAAGRLSTLLLSGADERPLHCVEKLAGGHGTGLGPHLLLLLHHIPQLPPRASNSPHQFPFRSNFLVFPGKEFLSTGIPILAKGLISHR